MAPKRPSNSRSAGPSPEGGSSVSRLCVATLSVGNGSVTLALVAGQTFMPGTFDIGLDGNVAGQLRIVAPARILTVSLPPHLLPATLDLLKPATGRSLFAAPLSLDASCAPIMETASIAGGCLSVTFTLAQAAMAEIAVSAMIEGGAQLAAGLAQQDGQDAAGRSRYRCSLPLLTLLRLGVIESVVLFVGGRRIDRAIRASAQDVGLVGYVGDASQHGITGWVADLRDPTRRIILAIVSGDRVLGTVAATLDRPEFAGLGIPTSAGFTIPHAMIVGLTDGARLAIMIAGTPTHLINSPLTINVERDVHGMFDNIDGNQACGWVMNVAHPDKPCKVEALCDGRVIGSAVANGIRRDVLEAGWPTDRCGYRITFTEPLHTLLGHDISVRVQGTSILLNGGPRQPKLNPNIAQYLLPDRGIAPAVLRRLRARIAHRTMGSAISIIMPVHNTRREWLVEALRSVCTQWCDRWELICVDDASTAPHVAMVLAWFAQTDARIRVIHTPRNLGIAGATTLGIQAARHPYVAFMDHDDTLEPDAVYHLIAAAKETGADVIYSDEAVTGDDISVILDVRARPAFSHDYYLSHPYFVHMVAVRTAIAQRIGGFDAALKTSADVDFILRAIEESRSVAHVPHVLYRWRTHSTSTGHETKGAVMAATTRIIQRHLDRVAAGAVVRPAPEFNQFEVRWPDPGGRVLIIIPTKDGVGVLRQCIESIEATVSPDDYRLVVIDHESKERDSKTYLARLAKRHTVMPYRGIFNYAQMNNRAIQAHGAGEPFVLFMNNDIEAIEAGWLERMRSVAARPEVGGVGTLLMYSDKRSQHGGVIVGINGLADHALRFEPVWEDGGLRNLGYNASLTSLRDFSAVTAACMMMRREVFEQVGGFDEAFRVGFNDTDLCLRIGRSGYKILYDGRTLLFHHESVTRIAKAQLKHPGDDARLREVWGSLLKAGDPFYSPNLELRGSDHTLRLGRPGPTRPRSVAVTMRAVARVTEAVPPPKPKKGRAESRVVAVSAD